MTQQQSPPAGWYDDQTGTGAQRYWDGQEWTDQVQQPPAAPAPEASTTRKKAPLVWGIAGAAVVALVVGGAFAWGPVSAALFPKHTLAETEFYGMAVDNLNEAIPDAAPTAYPGDNGVRQSPGFRAAAQALIDETIAGVDPEMEFDSVSEADEYSYSTIYSDFTQLEIDLNDGGVGTPLAEQSFAQDAEIVAMEQQIAAMSFEPSADGTYWEAAEQIAAVVGSTSAGYEELTQCRGDLDITTTAGLFCAAEVHWDQIFFTPLADESATSRELVDIMKHELAHKLIHVQCSGAFSQGKSAWNDAIGEGVTNSYAVIYLGADAAYLSQDNEYLITPETDAKARAVHEGDLACFDDDRLPPA